MNRLNESLKKVDLMTGYKRILLKVGFLSIIISLLINTSTYSQKTFKYNMVLVNSSDSFINEVPIIITRQQWNTLSGKVPMEEVPCLSDENG